MKRNFFDQFNEALRTSDCGRHFLILFIVLCLLFILYCIERSIR